MQEFSNTNNTSTFNFQGRDKYSESSLYDLAGEKKRITLGTEEVKLEVRNKWSKKYAGAQIFSAPLSAMSSEVVDFLLSFDLVYAYDDIAKQVGLDENGRNILPKIVWRITQSKEWDSLDRFLQEKLPNYPIGNISQLLKERILNKIRVLSEKSFIQKNSSFGEVPMPVQSTVKLTLAEALGQFPKLNEQSITIEQISIRSLPVPARPSIKNWIADYHDKNGVGKHSPIDRGNYLFHSENGKKLSPIERQKLGMILKSLDEQSILNIDTEKQIVIFENETNLNAYKTDSEKQNSNQEPTDIFELKINTTGNGLQKSITPQVRVDQIAGVDQISSYTSSKPIVKNPAPSTASRVDIAPRVPASLPTENFDLENKHNNQNNHAINQIGSAEFDQASLGFSGRRQESEKIIAKENLDFSSPIIKEEVLEKPKVELKNISFSPSFVAVPKNENAINQRLGKNENPLPEHLRTLPLSRETENKVSFNKEEIFSIPGSKPPIGTEHFDVNRAQEEKIAAMANKAFAAMPNPVANIDHKKELSVQNPTEKLVVPEKSEEKKDLEVDLNNVNMNDLDSLSDEMLFKLYMDKKNSIKSVNSSASLKQKGFHIGPITASEENEKIKNVVDLKNL